MSGVALVTIVHDEEAWLDAFLDHHRAIGVQRAYVVLDRCTDRSEAVAAARPWVTTIVRDRPESCRWLSEFQALILPDVYARATADGFEWLAFLDVDEFAWGGPVGSTGEAEGRLDRLTASVGPEIESIRLRTVEVVPEAIPMRTDTPERHVRVWALAHVQPEARFDREIADPLTGERRSLAGFLGHPRGKVLVRTGRGLVPVDAHEWRDEHGGAPPEVERGCHLHVVVADGEHFSTKYGKLDPHPVWPDGQTVAFPKRAFVEAASALSPGRAAAYFDREVAVGS
ncbi:MAG: glycosyltransferase family 2 protein, partial [Actinomycetota bacterium]